MKKAFNFIFLILVMTLFSCEDTIVSNPAEDFIIFGIGGVHCFKECDHFYKVENDRLLEDIEEDPGEGDFYEFNNFLILTDSIFELVKDIGNFIPEELLSEPSGFIGEADISDVGVLYFEMKNGSVHQSWTFARGDYDMPSVYAEFMDKIEEKMALIP